MVTIDLVTGFLGAGKTTFLKAYAKNRMAAGENICILENDFGAVNVDMLLLQDLEGENCELEMVSGGCDADCHRRRFKTKLISMGMCGYDRVIVEPSGIYDTDEFFDALQEEPIDRWYRIGNVIAVADAGMEEELSDEAKAVLASELAGAGMVVFSRTKETLTDRTERTMTFLNRVLEEEGCPRRFSEQEFLAKDWDLLSEEDFERIASCGSRLVNLKRHPAEENGFQSVYFMNRKLSAEKLKEKAEKILADFSCGKVFRIKGFAEDKDGSWKELNAAHDHIRLEPIARGQDVVIVIGEDLNEEAIGKYFL